MSIFIKCINYNGDEILLINTAQITTMAEGDVKNTTDIWTSDRREPVAVQHNIYDIARVVDTFAIN